MNVEPQPTLQRIGSGYGDRPLTSFEIGAKVETRRYAQLGNHHIATEKRRRGGAGQTQTRVGSGAHARRVAQTNALSSRADVHLKNAVLIAAETRQCDSAAAGC